MTVLKAGSLRTRKFWGMISDCIILMQKVGGQESINEQKIMLIIS